MQNPPPPPPPSEGLPPPPPPPGGYPQAPPPAYTATPGYGYAPQTTYGGFWIRFLAIFIDSLIIAIPIVIVGVFLGIAAGITIGLSGNDLGLSTSNPNQAVAAATSPLVAFIRLIAFLLTAGYFIYFWGTGSTLGMRLFRLRVVDATTGAPIGFGRATIRYLGYLVSVVVCYVGLIWAAFDGRKQGWHDKMANTVVLQG